MGIGVTGGLMVASSSFAFHCEAVSMRLSAFSGAVYTTLIGNSWNMDRAAFWERCIP